MSTVHDQIIADVYAAVPDVACKGLCHAACGPIGCSGVEANALQEQGIGLPVARIHPVHGPLTCSHLSSDGRCGIYANRPLICRVFGAADGLRCPHGCRPKQMMSDAQAHALQRRLDGASDLPVYEPPVEIR